MKAKDIQRMIDALSWEGNALFDRYTAANHRADLLSQASHDYDDKTIETQTPEECAKLDRLIDIASRAHRLADRLADRRDLLMQSCANLETVRDLMKPKRLVKV